MSGDGEAPRREIRDHILFEIATEVANRVGGIYSVLKSKAPVTGEHATGTGYRKISRLTNI